MEMPSMEVGEVEPEGNAGWSSGDGDIAYDTGKEFADNTQGMIIKSAYLGVETLEFDVFIRNLEGKVKVLGGYIESSNIQEYPENQRAVSPQGEPIMRLEFPAISLSSLIMK